MIVSRDDALQKKEFCVLTTAESKAKIWPVNTFKPPMASAAVVLLFIIAPIVCGGFVFDPWFVFGPLSISLYWHY